MLPRRPSAGGLYVGRDSGSPRNGRPCPGKAKKTTVRPMRTNPIANAAAATIGGDLIVWTGSGVLSTSPALPEAHGLWGNRPEIPAGRRVLGLQPREYPGVLLGEVLD